MTRKDYILIAGKLNQAAYAMNKNKQYTEVYKQSWLEGFGAAVWKVASALKSDNLGFDVDRFMDAVLQED